MIRDADGFYRNRRGRRGDLCFNGRFIGKRNLFPPPPKSEEQDGRTLIPVVDDMIGGIGVIEEGGRHFVPFKFYNLWFGTKAVHLFNGSLLSPNGRFIILYEDPYSPGNQLTLVNAARAIQGLASLTSDQYFAGIGVSSSELGARR